MPIRITTTAGYVNYTNPLVNGPLSTMHVKLDISTMTANEVDADGYLKPGVALAVDGSAIDGTEAVYGVTFEAIKVANGNTALAGDVSDPLVVVATHALVNRDIAEDNLGRAYTAAELAGFNTSNGIKLTTT